MPVSTTTNVSSFPKRFTIPQLATFLEDRIPHMANPHHLVARDDIYQWWTKYVMDLSPFRRRISILMLLLGRFPIYASEKDRAAFLQRSRFDVMAALSFPYADGFQLGACLMFYLWAFVVRKMIF